MKNKYDFLFAGVGGQGTILASDILCEIGLRCGYDVKKSEVHGMSQRGGAVESHVRWGEKVYSPLIEEGKTDFLLAFEMLEAARWPHYTAANTVAIINRHQILPPSVNLGQAQYPEEKEIESILAGTGAKVVWVDGAAKALELGNAALGGVVLLGALSIYLDEPVEVWEKTIAELVPAKFKELNIKAFQAGRELMQK
ncbi:indolepyruvate oxidoreductase subunit beta [Pelotomaculum terephthalicicum JT]|uniref:indolepyruvate oxidoreductase subunit beta n=1 Tax=Pelotomaculum TaxID=191373 RepID=UPI0009D53181|nr:MULTISPECIES: indolepyruvate oxidoreductase subunit beta [Pelotomaculum]MCG9966525.1 indolepyruvate oxidoreductase subunit beta [Pelotomaculum terephthalicicum JT]OPX89568.1 MAG: indolepyruvate oxidoreductase subunit beta [Pelotomaculum sp. PtaB.Bin117]OPY62808.1 MAG: indolepyruvate oxidoreductase subunit beta [Pelotomaculum sp. PtaU1.Bin065]